MSARCWAFMRLIWARVAALQPRYATGALGLCGRSGLADWASLAKPVAVRTSGLPVWSSLFHVARHAPVYAWSLLRMIWVPSAKVAIYLVMAVSPLVWA